MGEGPVTVRPGYGLYDRVSGIMYMLGVWDMLDRLDGKKSTA
ncbi:MAG: mannonate dehydratase [Faecousia sp.]